MVRPSRPDFQVVGVFNPAAIRHEGEVILLLRVAETPPASADEVVAPVYDANAGRLYIERWSRNSDTVDQTDPRIIVADGRTWLTSISHLRIARSNDGVNFEVETTPAFSPLTGYESFGIEDPRITLLDGTYWINYTAVSHLGISTALVSTKDFRTFDRHGIIFAPPNRDVTIFPAKIGGQYAALHRPMPEGIGQHAIWAASSPDLMSWGRHRFVAGGRPGGWEDSKIGGGAVPFRVMTAGYDGWLAVYHGVAGTPPTYSLGALLLDAQDPAHVIARSREPILRPDAPYERDGFFGGVVFTCGLVVDDDDVRIYYGAADGVTALARLSLGDILAGLSEP